MMSLMSQIITLTQKLYEARNQNILWCNAMMINCGTFFVNIPLSMLKRWNWIHTHNNQMFSPKVTLVLLGSMITYHVYLKFFSENINNHFKYFIFWVTHFTIGNCVTIPNLNGLFPNGDYWMQTTTYCIQGSTITVYYHEWEPLIFHLGKCELAIFWTKALPSLKVKHVIIELGLCSTWGGVLE